MIVHTFIKSFIIRVLVITGTLFLLSSCLAEYTNHFDAEHNTILTESGEYRGYYTGDTLWILPDKNLKKEIISTIENAQNRVWLEIYMITDKDILRSLIDAHIRGVDVQVLLEGNVYSLPYANSPIYRELQKHGVPVKYADGYRFTFTHAKFCIIDDRFLISTGNFTKSFFESNRDFVFGGSDVGTLNFLLYLFSMDFSYQSLNTAEIPSHIVLSPNDSRKKIEDIISSAEHNVTIYTQTLQDISILNILKQKKEHGISIRICTANNEGNQLSSSGTVFDWVLMQKPYLHGKIILIDGEKIFLGSQNLTENSLENNREVGILLSQNPLFSQKILSSFERDCIFE